jgi:hypothetical protein
MNIFDFLSNPGSVLKKLTSKPTPKALENGVKTLFMYGVTWAFGGFFGNAMMSIAKGVDPMTQLAYDEIPSVPDSVKVNLPAFPVVPGLKKNHGLTICGVWV